MLGHSHSFDDAYDHTLKPRGMSGSASTLWQSSGMEDTEVDYISLGEEKNFVKSILKKNKQNFNYFVIFPNLVPYTPMSPTTSSAPPTGVPFPNM